MKNQGTFLSKYILGFLLIGTLILHRARGELCDVTTGQNAVILDITESLSNDVSQKTTPEELPIEGDVSSISLTILDGETDLFQVDGKSLRLVKPLDRDQDDISTIRFEVNCKSKISSRQKSFPVIIRVADENDNVPIFIGSPYSVAIPESNRVGALVFDGIRARDIDSGVNGQVVYKLKDVSPSSGRDLFDIKLPHQGGVYLTGPLDYETTTSYTLTIEASDLAFRPSDRHKAETTLRVNVLDIDDHDPEFDTAQTPTGCPDRTICQDAFEYHSTVIEGSLSGILDMYPNRIHARDPDLIGAQISYSFQRGSPGSYREYFQIDSETAEITQIKKVDRSDIKHFQIIVQATEETRRRGRSTAKVLITVQGVDASPPRLVVSSPSGIVQESSPIGTPVLKDDGSGDYFLFTVEDLDYKQGESLPNYVFELTTSDFRVNENGILVIANDKLDRDPPSLSTLSFQAIAREDKPNGVASSPLLITVKLTDINDNPPTIPVYPTISISAGVDKRLLLNVKAEDIDEGENARVRYALLDDANGKFSIDPITGDVISEGELKAMEQFQLKIQATDSGGLSGTGFLDVVVSRGPNTNGPIFHKSRYTVAVSESIPFGQSILTVKATDPEGDSPYFSIVEGSGTESFEVDTLSGVVTVVGQLDREQVSQYNIIVKAEDREGASNTAMIDLRVLDVNDESPRFIETPYTFRVNEGQASATVGIVQAEDNDLDNAGKVFYSMIGTEPFTINSTSGELKTRVALDYETQQVHYIPILARDQGADPLSSTATVTVLVNDLGDETPKFATPVTNVSIKEDTSIGSLVTTVLATDSDTQPSITYKMLEGDADLFRVDSVTGKITLLQYLDYEKATKHVTVIGTEEANINEARSQTIVNVMVEDANDEMPVLGPFRTITMPQDAPVGSLLVKAAATDADGTSPNNKVTYDLSGVVSSVYFQIDKNTGEIRLKRSVRDLEITEFEVKITATDGGIPPLSTSTEFVILMLKRVTETALTSNYEVPLQAKGSPLASAPRFSKTFVNKMVREDIAPGTLVLKLPMVNSSSAIACSILESDAGDQFRVLVTQEQSCALQVMRKFDYETQKSFSLTLVLHPASVSVSSVVYDDLLALSKAEVTLTVMDLNDNPPVFDLGDSYVPLKISDREFIVSLMTGAPAGTQLLSLKAYDLDAEGKSEIEFRLEPMSNRGNFFSINSKTGRVVTQRSLTNVPTELVPFNLSFVATDSPDEEGLRLSTKINVLVPIIEKSHQSVLLLDAQKELVENRYHEVTEILSQSSGTLAQIEDIKPLRRSPIGNFSQVWFHLLDSKTLQPVDLEVIHEPKTEREVVQRLKSSLNIAEAKLITPSALNQKSKEELNTAGIRTTTSPNVVNVGTALDFGYMEFGLLSLAVLTILFVLVASIVTCVLWSRFSSRWNQADKTIMMIPPVISRPTESVADGMSKEYEVQVLHMSVPVDDDSIHEFLPSESPKQFFLDNVSYISRVPTDNGVINSDEDSGSIRSMTPRTAEYDSSEFNPIHSSVNSNVIFGRRLDQSPVETTTEL